MTATGRPWDELEDTLTVPRLTALQAQWLEVPPVADLLAAQIGYKPPAPIVTVSATSKDDPSGIGGLIAQFPSGFIPASR
jgi:hypothetical protein